MTKKYILLLFTLILSLPLLAQLEVKEGSFKEVLGFVNINSDENYQLDDNDLPFAVIKVRTENITDRQRRELRFESNLAVGIMLEYKTGEVWVYLTAKYADYLKISHPDFSSTEYILPFDLQPKKGYEMTLVNKTTATASGFGSLTVTTKPESDATISMKINGDTKSYKSPHTFDILPAGIHEITISKERFKIVTKFVEIKDKENKKVEIEMPIDVASIVLKADYLTEVYIDGFFKTKGTWHGELKSGTHHILYKKQNHKDTIQTIFVEAGVQQTIELKPIPITGTISIKSEPSDATIYIDNDDIGKTPLKINYIIGNHNIKLSKEGYESQSWNMVLNENDTLIYNKVLNECFKVTIQTDGTYDRIYIDGEYKGYSRVTESLTAGKHKIIIERSYNKKVEREIIVTPEGDKVFSLTVDPTTNTSTRNEASNIGANYTLYDDDYYNPWDKNSEYNKVKDIDLSIHFDIGCFVGLGIRSMKCTDSEQFFLSGKYWGYFAKGLYTTFKINKIGLKAEITNLNVSGHTLDSEYLHTYPYVQSYEYEYNFATINIPIMIGYETDKTDNLLFSVYLGRQINICNSASYNVSNFDTETTILSNQSLTNYEKISYNTVGEINFGWRYEKLSISFLSLKFDITRPTIIKNNGTEKFSGDLKFSSFIWSMQMDYNF